MKKLRPRIVLTLVLFLIFITSIYLLLPKKTNGQKLEFVFFLSSLSRNENTQVVEFITKHFGNEIKFTPVYLFSKTNSLEFSNGQYYTATNGRSEANQNIRELCAFDLAKNLSQWWQFITDFSANCQPGHGNPDTCWVDSASKSGFNPNTITDCFNQQAQSLIESQLAITSKLDDPQPNTALLNNQIVITNFQLDNLKLVICQSFAITPKVCHQSLDTYDY
ncbi:MAG: hypothetical protein WCV93_03590 [Candidatus Shapirobacteria bacterium]|jgi:hypothetical protein